MSDYMEQHPVVRLSRQYPQLLLPVKCGTKDTEEYKDAVLRGNIPERIPDFSLDEDDKLSDVTTPAGTVQVLFLHQRGDFEHAVRALAYRCEPVEIPSSMGATSISGLINWKKIHDHIEAYLCEGGTDTASEFSRFTGIRSNYLDCLIVLSSGEYSNVPSEKTGMDKTDWLKKSLMIREYHELTHFYCRKLYLENKNEIRDEILADMIGIIAAIGRYEENYARSFLGIEGLSYREGGRLQNYTEKKNLEPAISEANRLIDLFSGVADQFLGDNLFQLIDYIEKNKIGL